MSFYITMYRCSLSSFRQSLCLLVSFISDGRYIMHKIYKAAYSPKREDDQRKDCEFAYKVRSLQFVTPDHLDIKYG
jgi:hypothetical protein